MQVATGWLSRNCTHPFGYDWPSSPMHEPGSAGASGFTGDGVVSIGFAGPPPNGMVRVPDHWSPSVEPSSFAPPGKVTPPVAFELSSCSWAPRIGSSFLGRSGSRAVSSRWVPPLTSKSSIVASDPSAVLVPDAHVMRADTRGHELEPINALGMGVESGDRSAGAG